MPLNVDLLTPRRSWLHAVDPRVKVLFVAASLVLLLRYRNVFFLLAALVLLLVLHASARTPLRRLATVGKALLPTNIIVVSLWILFYPSGEPFAQFWFVKLTLSSVAHGVALALRIDSMALAVFLWLFTTDQPSLVRGLVKLGLPYEWGLTLALALRYIPSFQGLYAQISDAQQARGLELNQGSGFRRVRTLMPVFVAVIIGALRSSEQLARALESRALGAPGIRRTYLRDLKMRPLDFALAAFILLAFAGLLALNVVGGLGAAAMRLI